MFKIISLLPNYYIKIIYNLSNAIRYKNIKVLYYNNKKDFEENNKKLSEIKLDPDYISSVLKENKQNFDNTKISWHWHLFAGLSKKNNLKILEVGTHSGEFANFLSKIFNDSQIDTIDLSSNDERFINSYNRQNENIRNQFLKKREQFLNKQNINFFGMDSVDLLNNFEKETYDIIWLDGDHINPQVNMDVLSTFYLLKKGGILLSDDLFFDPKAKYLKKSQASDGIVYLTNLKKLNTHYFIKRCHPTNAFNKKYISFSIKN
jgi:predicted O-methyltransferase YrrM